MLKIYNTLSHKKEFLKPAQKGKVDLFVCGPTVYDFPHLGHARTYLVFDMIVSFLKELKIKTFYLQNITDIDDKIIKRAKEKNITPKKLALRFEKEYIKDMRSLKIDTVTKYARATDYIPEIISQVQRLIKKDKAYKIEDGIYFDIKKFKEYGKLSKRKISKSEDAVSRIDESKNKRNKGDFCLWKFSKKGEPSWKSPFGEGRPGWHIEDTAIAERFFGFQYDIHGGARDLIFPHHEAEISQMESLSNKKPMAKYWIHTGFLTVKGKKMSKSLGNFITIREFLKDNSPELLRMLILSSNYRSPIDYTKNNLNQAKKNLERLTDFSKKVKKQKSISKITKEHVKLLEDDFNAPKFLSSVFELIKKSNKRSLSEKERQEIGSLMFFINRVFKIFPKKKLIPKEIIKLADLREKYRKENNWKKADNIREKIEKLGYRIRDRKAGSEIKKM